MTSLMAGLASKLLIARATLWKMNAHEHRGFGAENAEHGPGPIPRPQAMYDTAKVHPQDSVR